MTTFNIYRIGISVLKLNLFASILIFLCLLGCEPDGSASPEPISNTHYIIAGYEPVKIGIVGLSEITSDEYGASMLNVYVDLIDSFGSRIKSPGLFRFELYEYIERTSQHAGKRLFISTDIDLTAPNNNNNYWKDHLRAYQFELPLDFNPNPAQNLLLQATYIKPDSKRLSTQSQLKN